MVKKIFAAFVFLILLILPPKVFAASEFTTSYDVNYDISEDGTTQVTENTILKNLTDTFYASSFVLSIGSTTLTDVTATDDGGNMETKVEAKDNKTIITVKLNQQITGVDKKQNFTLRYRSKDFAAVLGKTWEINLPRIHSGSDIESFNVTLSVPMSFGEPTSIAPKPKSESDYGGQLVFKFTKDQLTNSGVSVNFGTNQIFDFNLKYNLDNTSFLPVVTSIALPPDTNYQDILINNIVPTPMNVTIDEDGNYLAWYQIPKRTKQQISVAGLAKLYINSKTNQLQKLSNDRVSTLTRGDRYWEKDNPNIQAVLKEIFKNKKTTTTHDKAQLIYQYVVNTLTYDTSRLSNLERMGAVTALINPQKAVCMEFTDLFISLARAAGIPARELDGYAYSQNKKLRPLSLSTDLLHAWPEYYDEKLGWIMVDPTWGNTSGGVDYFNKFDLNHIVLAIRGVSSVRPSPGDEVKAEISEVEFKEVTNPKVEILVNDNLWAGLPGSGEVKISNSGALLLPGSNLNISTSKILILNSKKISIPDIPPFGYSSYNFNLRAPFLWQTVQDKIEVNYMGQKYTKQISITPVFLYFSIPYALFVLVAALGLGYALILGLHYHHKKTRKASK